MTRDLPSPELLRKLLRYEPETGKLFWRARSEDLFNGNKHACRRWNSRYAGKEAMTPVNEAGYKIGGIFNKSFRAHRVIWAMTTGRWPSCFIDHVNGDRSDNRILNLREATTSQNAINSCIQSNNTSGLKGASWCKRTKKWQSYIAVGGKKYNLGYFDCREDAHEAYCHAAKKRHGDYANLGNRPKARGE